MLPHKPSVPSNKQLLSRIVFQRLEQSTILSWHRNKDGAVLAYVECPYCELVEEFITVEAAATFGIIHRRDPFHVDRFLRTLQAQLERKN